MVPGLVRFRASQESGAAAPRRRGRSSTKSCFPGWGRTGYSKLFELCFRSPVRRQKYIEEKIEQGRPGWVIPDLEFRLIPQTVDVLTTVFTTNLRRPWFITEQPQPACAHHNAGGSQRGLPRGRHHQLTRPSPRSSSSPGTTSSWIPQHPRGSASRTGKRMAEKFKELSRQIGLVVIGYAGRDQSVMSMLELLLETRRASPTPSIGVWPGGTPRLAGGRARRSRSSSSAPSSAPDFDSFMAGLHAELKLELPVDHPAPPQPVGDPNWNR